MKQINPSLIISADGSPTQFVRPKNGTDFQLEELQKIVGGNIEVVYLSPDTILVINDEGKLTGLPPNRQATNVARKAQAIAAADYIAGIAVMCETELLK